MISRFVEYALDVANKVIPFTVVERSPQRQKNDIRSNFNTHLERYKADRAKQHTLNSSDETTSPQ